MARHQAQTGARDAISGVEQHLGQPPVTPDERKRKSYACCRKYQDTERRHPYVAVLHGRQSCVVLCVAR